MAGSGVVCSGMAWTGSAWQAGLGWVCKQRNGRLGQGEAGSARLGSVRRLETWQRTAGGAILGLAGWVQASLVSVGFGSAGVVRFVLAR